MKTIAIFITLLFSTNILISQEQCGFKGTVRCADNNEPLSGVTILVESLKTGTSTDENGHYEMSLPSGSYSIRFSFVGYMTEVKEIIIRDGYKELNVMLKTDSQILDAVVVSSTKKDANVSELKMSIQTIDMVQIRKIPSLMGEVDVIKSIQLLPGA